MTEASLQDIFNDISADAQPDLMTDKEYTDAFTKMERDFFIDKIRQERPVLLYVTGLPGSGKSTAVRNIKKNLDDEGSAYVHINFDDLRVYHPRYAQHVSKDPVNAAARIDKATETLIGWLCEESSKRGLNVILDDAAMGADMTQIVLGPFNDAGYEIKANILAVPAVIACQSVHLRFEKDFAAASKGMSVIPRWVNTEEQENAPAALVETVETIEEKGLADSIVVVDRDLNVIAGKASETIRYHLHRELTASEIAAFQDNAEEISRLLSARNKAAKTIIKNKNIP